MQPEPLPKPPMQPLPPPPMQQPPPMQPPSLMPPPPTRDRTRRRMRMRRRRQKRKPLRRLMLARAATQAPEKTGKSMPLDSKTHQAYWQRYVETRDPSIRETLITENAHLIKYVAGRLNIYFGAHLEFDDLVSFGVFGLIDAIDKFDPGKGVKFETYASLRIRGAIIDNIRELDWVPRSLRQKGKDLEKAYAELEYALGRLPTDQETADRLGLTMKEFNKFIGDASVSTLVSLEEVVEQGGEFDDSPWFENADDDPARRAENSELRDILAEEIDKLTEKEKSVITFYYYNDLTLREISSIMKVSESRISQLHTKAIAKLRGMLSKHMSYLGE